MLKDKILKILEQNKGRIISGGDLAKRLGISRTAVWKAVNALKNDGFQIESLKNSGYRFISDNDLLSEELIRKDLKTKIFGNKIEILKSVDSTNLYLKRNYMENAQEGALVVADEQVKGQGRMNRTFYSPQGEGIYISFLLKPDMPISDISFLTICAAVSVCRAIENVCELNPKIKWVNDILYNDKKLCGILTEAVISAEAQTAQSVVIGIGLNTGEIANEVEGIATSLYRIKGKRGYRNRLIAEIAFQLEEIYLNFIKNSNKQSVLDEYIKRLAVLGKKVSVLEFDKNYEAVVKGVNETGGLVLEDEKGNDIHLKAGEIKII